MDSLKNLHLLDRSMTKTKSCASEAGLSSVIPGIIYVKILPQDFLYLLFFFSSKTSEYQTSGILRLQP